MTTWTPTLLPPWSPTEMDEILHDALRVLDQIGVECTHPGVRARLAERGGVRFVDRRVHFAEERVRAHLEGLRGPSDPPSGQDDVPFSMGGCWACLNYCDPETLEVRPATSGEAAQMARLWDARGLSGVVPLMPGDVPPALATLAAERIALKHSRFLGGFLTVIDPKEVRFLIDMFAAAGRRYHLMEQVGISPLRLDERGLETALCFLDDPDVDVTLSGFIPMAGATCPLDPRSALVQALAEELALDLVRSCLGLSAGGLSLRVDPFDLQYAAIVFGSPEWCLYRALVIQMNGYLTGRPARSGMFRSVAKRPDAQAACERTASVLWQALLGARHLSAVGQLSVDEVFSPQQAVLDREILAYVRRTIEGLELGPDAVDPVALIGQGVREGSFVGVADTVSRFRAFFTFPDLFRRWNLGRWRAEGQPALLDEAWARARAEIAGSAHRLDEEQERQVDRIYRKAERSIRNRP